MTDAREGVFEDNANRRLVVDTEDCRHDLAVRPRTPRRRHRRNPAASS